MDHFISERELTDYLNLLKDSIQEFDYSCLNNVIFFNFQSFYRFTSTIPCGNHTVSEVLDIVSRYIPLALSPQALNAFLCSCENYQDLETDAVIDKFQMISKVDFFQLVRQCQKDSDWQRILSACKAIRENIERIP